MYFWSEGNRFQTLNEGTERMWLKVEGSQETRRA